MLTALAQPAPFAKAVGGKSKLADRVLAFMPPGTRRYVEPFVGGGAVFFAARSAGFTGEGWLGDTNAEFICAYRAVRDDLAHLLELLREYAAWYNAGPSKDFYDLIRSLDVSTETVVERAARFLFLNKTAFNGLWRENLKGEMNAPWGKYVNPPICDESRLRAASKALQNTTLNCQTFDATVVLPDDFVYLDPPYWPVSRTASFVAYGRAGFGPADQARVRDRALEWAASGATVVVSNADVPEVRALYASGFELHEVTMARGINSDAGKRGKVGELLMVAHRRNTQ